MSTNSLRTYAGYAISLVMFALLCSCVEEPVKKTEPAVKPVEVQPAPPPPPVETPEQIAAKAARAAAQTEFDGIMALYSDGDYRGEIKRFTTAEETLKPYKELELDGLKFTAFSYCLLGKQLQCRQQFEKAIKIDPSFDLKEGEKGHPLWGPVFKRVKKKEGSAN
jgi:tetratricopeptide (TPR) repeat protein